MLLLGVEDKQAYRLGMTVDSLEHLRADEDNLDQQLADGEDSHHLGVGNQADVVVQNPNNKQFQILNILLGTMLN